MQTPQINLLELETVDSTNLYAKEHFDVLSDGTLVCAEAQTAGRGRLGRHWFSPPGVNIYASLVMKRITNPFYATAAASLAALEMLRTELPRGGFFIKWPNDIYAGWRKISGILCEGVSDGGALRGVIAGIGVNINLTEPELDGAGAPAASLKALSGTDHSVHLLTAHLAERLAEYYAAYLKSPEKLFAEWKSSNLLIGRRVNLSDPAGVIHAVRIHDIADSGELIAEHDGALFRFHCGDVILQPESLSA